MLSQGPFKETLPTMTIKELLLSLGMLGFGILLTLPLCWHQNVITVIMSVFGVAFAIAGVAKLYDA
jgi:hypothetical protein